MARAYTVVMMILLAATTVAFTAVGIDVHCEGDHECGREKYCYIQSGYCVPCTNCNMYKRENRTLYPYCAKSAVECGKCLPGFEEEIFTTGEVRDSCIPISSPSEDQPMALYIGVTLTAFLLAVVVAYFFYRSYRKQSNMHCFSEHVRSSGEERTPEDRSMPAKGSPLLATSYAAVEAGVSDIRETRFTVCGEKEHQPLQQARPFQCPNTPYHSDDEQEEPPDTPPYLYDEETMESEWIPPDCEEVIPANTTVPNNQTDGNELPSSSQSANTANTSVDSGLSNISSAASSASLPQHPVEGLESSSNAVVSIEPSLTSHTRSHSDDDVSTSARSPKRARRDSGAQSLDEDRVPINVVIINVQNCTTEIHK
jgi:hypothetical protein